MKKLHSRGLALLTAAALSLSALGTAAGAAGEGALPLTVNGAETGITVTEENGGYIVPLRALAEYLGYTVAWHGEDSTVTLDSGSMHATVTLGVNRYQAVTSLEGAVGMTAPFSLAAAPYAVDGTTYVPLELFVVLMGNPADAVTANDGAVELTAEAAGSGAQLPSPWEEYGSLSGLEQAAGFPVPLPVLPEGFEAVSVSGHPRPAGGGALLRRRGHPDLPGGPWHGGYERGLQRLSRRADGGGGRRIRHLQGGRGHRVPGPVEPGRVQLLPRLGAGAGYGRREGRRLRHAVRQGARRSAGPLWVNRYGCRSL